MNRSTPAGLARAIFLFTIAFLILLFAEQSLVVSTWGASPPVPVGQRQVQPFDFKGVVLLPGSLKTQVDQTRQFYLSIPNDSLLKGFRTRAGRFAPGKDMGGWYTADVFTIFGQVVSGLARLYAATGDPQCALKANMLVAEWAKCIESDGYFFATRHPNAPHYIYDKMLWGLLDTYVYCGNTQSLTHLSRITDWAMKNLGRSRLMNDITTEWYTLSENLYRAFILTGDVKYRDFALGWEYHQFWNIYKRGGDIFGPRSDGTSNSFYHAYSHVNSLGGAAAAYMLKGDEEYLQLLVNAAEDLRQNQCFVSGGYGPDELLLPHGELVARLGQTHNCFETQCGSWAVFKLVKYLLSFTGDASYGDWVERLIYNGIGASIPISTNGCVYYYSDYSPYGGQKQNISSGWTCCAGTRPQAVADYLDLIFFHDDRDLYVNLFTPSMVTWTNQGSLISLTQSTSFPESEQTRLVLGLSRPTAFAVKLRVPQWLDRPMVVSVNGTVVKPEFDEKNWASLEREWRNGDEIKVSLPMDFWNSSLDERSSTPVFTMYGPVMMAIEAPAAQVLARINVNNLGHTTVPIANRPLWFNITTESNVRIRPFYSFRQGEVYFPSCNPKTGTKMPHQIVKFSGTWWDATVFRDSNQVGDTAECSFEGTGIRWLGKRFNDAGYAEIAMDGKVIATVSQYGASRSTPFDWTIRGLPMGLHTIRLRVMAPKPPGSLDRYLNVIGFEVVK